MQTRALLMGRLLIAVACLLGCARHKLEPSGSGTPVRDGGAAVDEDDAGQVLGTRLAKGRRCTSAAECASGFCADGVCCASACTDACWSCNQEVTAGLCLVLPPGAPPKSPGACPSTPPETCGYDGTCNGAGTCGFHRAGTLCAPGACSGRTAVVGRNACNGFGMCQEGATIICVPYACDPAAAACRTSCVTDTDCEGRPCVDGRCPTALGPARCTQNVQCASGFCADGFCCDTACDGNCVSCDVPSREGTCWPRPDLCPGADAGSD